MVQHNTIDHTGLTGVGAALATDTLWQAAGDLVQGTGADTATVLTAGTTGHVLTSNGAAAAVSWQAPAGSGGGLVLLEQHTASSSATLDFTACITSTYDEYQIEIVNVIPATNSTNLYLRVSTDAGSSYIATGVYSYIDYRHVSGAAAASGGSAQNQILVTNGTDLVSNSALHGVCGQLRLFSPLSTAVHKRFAGQISYVNTGSAIEGSLLGATYAATTAVDAFRFLFGSGNIASGTIRVYGIAK